MDMVKITCQIVDSLSRVPRGDWERIFSDVPEGYEFYKTLEESRLEGFSFYYLLLSRADKIILIAPLFTADFNLDIAAEGALRKVIGCIRRLFPRFLIVRTLFCGSPFGEQGLIGIDPRERGDQSVAAALYENMDLFCRQRGIGLMMFKDFTSCDSAFLERLSGYGFFRVESFPCAAAELAFSSFEEYLNSLGRSTRKNLRRKLRDARAKGEVIVKSARQIEELIEPVYRLYLNTYSAGSTRFEKLTRDFFLSVSRNMGDRAVFFLYYVNGKLGAVNLCFIYKDILIDKFIGFDYHISDKYHLYFLSWCYNVEWCVNNSIRYYVSGQTDYQAKVRLGSGLSARWVYLRHRNKTGNMFMRMLALVLKPDNFDHAVHGK